MDKKIQGLKMKLKVIVELRERFESMLEGGCEDM